MSSLSTSLYGTSTNKGVGGLLSGLDTDDLVKQMTAATRNKINRQYQSKQKLLYRQEAYREISKKLLTFSDKYFSYSSGSKTNILSSRFFESNTYKSSSSYVNVTGNANEISNFKINSISSVAKAASHTTTYTTTSQSFSSGDILSEISSLAGDTMTIEYDGTKYNLKISEDFKYSGQDLNVRLNDIAAELNKQLDSMVDKNNNKLTDSISYKAENGEIVFEKGAAKLVAASNDILKTFNIDKISEDTSASSNGPVSGDVIYRTAEDVFLNSTITFDYNGVKKTIDLSGMGTNYTYDAAGLKGYLKEQLDKAYGTGNVNIELNETSTALTFSSVGTNVIKVSNLSSDLSILTGIKSGDSNRLNTSKAIGEIFGETTDYSITINGKQIDGINKDMAISDILKKINAESDVNITYSSTTDGFVINSKETGAHAKIDISGGLANVLFGGPISGITGTDTIMNCDINGESIDIVRSTTNFTIDGINVELSKNAVTDIPITFDVINNADEVVERVKQFISDYNEIINLIGTKTSEKPKRDYLPLTPEQQEEMEEEEIKNWNDEAKKGSLYGDSKMNTVLRRMRESMSGLTDVSSITLSSIGISSASMDTSGKLILDEAKFKSKLLENPDEIANLFTMSSTSTSPDAKSGISQQLQKILRDNVGVYGTSGLLIEEAGLENSMTSDKNYISEKIEEYDEKMAELKKDLEAERKRYWNQFSALEQSLNKLNAQSSWLTDMMG